MITFKFVNGDFVLSPTGKLETVSGFEALKKNIQKILVTYKENSSNTVLPNRYNPNYGTNIPFLRAILGPVTRDELINAIQDELVSTILYYTNNIQPEKSSIVGFTPDAYLKDADVTVYPDLEDNGVTKVPIIRYEVEIVSAGSNKNTTLDNNVQSNKDIITGVAI